MKKMKLKYLIFLFPLLAFIDLVVFTQVSEFLRANSDMAVVMGVILACILVMGNYFLIDYIYKQTKTKK